MERTPVSLLEKVRNPADQAAWKRFVHLYTPLLIPLGPPPTELDFHGTQVADLSPLRDMKLMVLNCHGTHVTDLAPLRDMPLLALFCGTTHVTDLSPLKDMKLTTLDGPSPLLQQPRRL